MKKNFKIVSLLTVFTLVLNVLSILVLMKPVNAAPMTGVSDKMSRLAIRSVVATDPVTHVLSWTTAGTGDIVITFPADFGGVAATTTTSCTATDNLEITCEVGVDTVTVTGLTNPTGIGIYSITLVDNTDSGSTQIVIVDSDQVLVNGYIATSLSFDLDVGDGVNDTVDCTFDGCLTWGNGGTNYGTNYTVDLGNLTVGAVNESGVSALHTDGTGAINYIYFDLSTNAASGAVLTMQSVGSRPGYLDGPGTGSEDIPSVTDGQSLTSGVAGYGYHWGSLSNYSTNYYDSNNLGIIWTLPVSGTGQNAGASGITINTNCGTNNSPHYCAIPTTASNIFATDGSIEGVRGKLALGASIDGTMVPGTYRDTLQFIATSTF